MSSWEELFIDRQIETAWLDLRLRIADHLSDTSVDRILNFETPTHDHLLVRADSAEIIVRANRSHYSPPNADAAALIAFQVLHKAWGVPHPAFLESEFLGRTSIEDDRAASVSTSVLGRARSVEELRTWVVASLGALTSDPIKTDSDNETVWCTPDGCSVWVVVPHRHAVELRSVLARGVSFRKAHELADKLTLRRAGLRFHLRQDTLFMSQVLAANPYVGEHVVSALGRFIITRDELGWVAEKVLSKRVRHEREELLKLKDVNAQLAAEIAEMRAAAGSALRDEPGAA